jgi:DNA-binding MarR family transcriptional regulator
VELARHLNVTSASVALSTKRMAKAGYLRKHVDEYNLRKNRLHVTEAGLKLQADCREIFDRYDHELFAGFSEAELAQLFDYFDRIEKNIAEDGEPCNNKNKDGENSL